MKSPGMYEILAFFYRKNEYYLCFLGHSLFPPKIGRSREIIVKILQVSA